MIMVCGALDGGLGNNPLTHLRGPLTQAVEYLPFKQRVAGSNPARPTKKAINPAERA